MTGESPFPSEDGSVPLESAEELGCGFHRAWYTDGGDFFALAQWESREGAQRFYDTRQIVRRSDQTRASALGRTGS